MTTSRPTQEKQAWYALGVVCVTLAAYGAFAEFVKFGPVSAAVFGFAGLLGIRFGKRRKGEIEFDERDREIHRRALLATLGVAYASLLVLTVVFNLVAGDDYEVPMWKVGQFLWAGSLAIWGLKSALIIAAYRKGRNA